MSRDASAVEVYKLGLPFSIKWYWKTLDKAHLFQWSAICYLRICSCLTRMLSVIEELCKFFKIFEIFNITVVQDPSMKALIRRTEFLLTSTQFQELLCWTFAYGQCWGVRPTALASQQLRVSPLLTLTQRRGRWWTCTRYTSVPSSPRSRRLTTSSTISRSLSCWPAMSSFSSGSWL